MYIYIYIYYTFIDIMINKVIIVIIYYLHLAEGQVVPVHGRECRHRRRRAAGPDNNRIIVM